MSDKNRVKPSVSGKLLDSETWDALKAAGVPESELAAEQPFGPIIFSYTRAQAIEDGVLVDVTDLAKKQGFVLHTVITNGVYEAMTDMIRRNKPEDLKKYPLYRVQAAAISALLQVLHEKIAGSAENAKTDRMYFKCGDELLWSQVGPGDNGEPVLTIMLQGED